MKPMAFFLHADGTMKTIFLSVKDEHQKEALIRRIRDKVLAENILTVIMLTEMDGEHMAILSGASPGVKGSARIDYNFDGKTKTIVLWKMRWLDQLVPNVFLDGIFDNRG